jgi:hypothetical protein
MSECFKKGDIVKLKKNSSNLMLLLKPDVPYTVYCSDIALTTIHLNNNLFCYPTDNFELVESSKKKEHIMSNKFKIGDVVKVVNSLILTGLPLEHETLYIVEDLYENGMVNILIKPNVDYVIHSRHLLLVYRNNNNYDKKLLNDIEDYIKDRLEREIYDSGEYSAGGRDTLKQMLIKFFNQKIVMKNIISFEKIS